MKIYVWRCDTCERKGATNIKPLNPEKEICLTCGEPLIIEVFKDVFLRFSH